MALSSDLISEFVKITNDKEETKKETTVYGTTVEYNGKTYVKLDGSDLLTPVSTTTDVKPDERVTVMIKNHTATITGNISSPAARTDDLQDARDEISQFEIVVAGLVKTDEFEAEVARIDTLEAENVTIKGNISANAADIDKLQANSLTVNEKLTAAEGNITKLQSEKIDTIAADAKFATIENLKATDADIHDLEATYGEFASLTATQLDALRADIDKLEAGEITVEELKATFATIAQLDVEKARIDDLEAEVGEIDTLMFGSATGSTLQTSFANAVIAQLGDAQIKSAMIENVSASKIISGDIITNNVRVMSEDGKLLISDETIQISDTTRVRVQIGKDSAGDYSINIWDADGKLMFSEGGITDSAIKEAIIRNDMVSDTANIAAHKLDIDSLFEEINGSEKTIKSTRIWLDDEGQSLDVAFETVTTDIEELQNGISSQGTQITAMQGQIAAKIWQTDIESAVSEVNETTDNLSTQYEEVVQEVDGLTATVASHTSEISKKADSSTVTEVSNKVASMETDLSGFKTTVSETYATKTEVDDISVGGTNLILNSTFNDNGNHWSVNTGKMTSYSFNEKDFGGHNSFEWSVTDRTSSGWIGISQHISIDKFKAGGKFILSGWAYVFTDVSVDANISVEIKRVTSGGDHIGFGTANLHDPSLPRDEWFYFEKEYNFPVEDTTEYYVFPWIGTNGHIKIAQLKLEAGTKATDWSPAPEDLASEAEVSGLSNRMSVAETSITQHATSIELRATKTEVETAQNTADDAQGTANHAEERVASAEALIQLLSECISMLVTDGDGQSLMTQTDDGWTFSTGDIQNKINAASENLDVLTNEVGDIDSTVGILQQAVDDLGVLSEYVKITTYEDEPCIELGETDSDFKLLITNTRIMFMEGTGVPAYITNQALHIKKAVVEEELQQGEFIWKARSNGNLGLIWKGGTN